MIKLISLDLDGTLLDPKGQITQASREAIAKARAAGLRVVVNTGRPIQEGFLFVREAGCDLLTAGAGGGLVADAETGAIVRQWDVPERSARRAIELCMGWDARLIVFAGKELLVTAECKKYMEATFPFSTFRAAVTVTEDFLGFMAERRLPLVKIYGVMGPGGCPVEELSALPDVTLTSSTSNDFELTAGGADKGSALAVIAARYGIPLEQCAAVGDSENDRSAFEVAGVPIAMGNAPQTVKDAALRVAPSHAEEGAAWAILSCLERR